MRKVDFHTHSHYSDGSNSIEEIIQAAINLEIEEIAITDHIDALGHFLFSRNNRKKTIFEYLREIAHLQRKYENLIKIYAGGEISEDFLKVPPYTKDRDMLQENLDFFSFFLIEGTFIQEPVLTAINMRKYLDMQKFQHIPVILAHPRYSSMNITTFHVLLDHNIGFELNEDKIDERDATYFLEFVQKLNPMEKSRLIISIGSDAHQEETVGSVNFSVNIIEKNSLWKYVMIPPKVQDYLFM